MINADHHVESDELMLSDRHRGSANFNGGAGDQGITESGRGPFDRPSLHRHF